MSDEDTRASSFYNAEGIEVSTAERWAAEIAALRWMRERVTVNLRATEGGGWWEIEAKDCTISIEVRPPYCDRGSYLAKLHPSGELAREIDFADGWPRYYFDPLRMMQEIEAWLVKRGQMP